MLSDKVICITFHLVMKLRWDITEFLTNLMPFSWTAAECEMENLWRKNAVFTANIPKSFLNEGRDVHKNLNIMFTVCVINLDFFMSN